MAVTQPRSGASVRKAHTFYALNFLIGSSKDREEIFMKKIMKAIVLTTLASVLATGCSSSGQPETSAPAKETDSQTEASLAEESGPAEGTAPSVTIGIGQFAVHGSLDNCREGFIQGLAEEGFIIGENLTLLEENAQSDPGLASQIATNFAGQNVDMICAIATPIAQSAYSAGRKNNIPVIYTAVTDPVAAELASEDGMPAGEVTGTSDKLPVEQQLAMIREILPEAKRIGILYTTSEVNSASTLAEYKEHAPEYGFEIFDVGVSSTADIPLATDSILQEVDCLNNLTDNTVVSSLPLILSKANACKIPVFGSEIEQVKLGCLAAMGLDYVELGKQTGHMAAKVLKGEAKASELPFEVIEEAAFYGNTDTAEALGISFPEALTKSAKELFGGTK
jgi:putative ABC transport system substrate-binding protein